MSLSSVIIQYGFLLFQTNLPFLSYNLLPGVLTKVDLVDKGAEKEIVRIMKDPDVYKVYICS